MFFHYFSFLMRIGHINFRKEMKVFQKAFPSSLNALRSSICKTTGDDKMKFTKYEWDRVGLCDAFLTVMWKKKL